MDPQQPQQQGIDRQKLMQALVAFGQANSRNSGINNFVLSNIMDMAQSEDPKKDALSNALMEIEAKKLAEGDMSAVSRLDALQKGGFSEYKSLFGDNTQGGEQEFTGTDEENEVAAANKLAQARMAAMETGDYSQFNTLRKDLERDYDVEVGDKPEDISVSKRKKQRSLAGGIFKFLGAGSDKQMARDFESQRYKTGFGLGNLNPLTAIPKGVSGNITFLKDVLDPSRKREAKKEYQTKYGKFYE